MKLKNMFLFLFFIALGNKEDENLKPDKDQSNNFRDTGKCPNCYLPNADFQGLNSATDMDPHPIADLKKANLRNTIFSGAVFNDSDFSGADLTGAQFSMVSCNNCNFENAILDHAQFNGAKLLNCNFTNASLDHTNFFMATCTESNFTGSKMNQTNFERAKLPYTSHHKSTGTYYIGNASDPGDLLYTNMCCSVKRGGTLDFESCKGGFPGTSLDECLRNFNNMPMSPKLREKMVPPNLLSSPISSFITQINYKFHLPKLLD